MDMDTGEKVKESKVKVCQILESKNQQFIGELKKNPQKSKVFQYSKFSPFSNFIKKNKDGALLKDVVSFIQTNIIKLYVEKGDKKAIYNFFSSSHNKKSVYIDFKEIQEFLDRTQDQSICAVTMALILENTGDYSKALEKWQQL